MGTVTLISARAGDRVPGHELADPECPEVPGLLDRPDVTEWLARQGYSPEDPDELVYLTLGEAEEVEIPEGFPVLILRV